MHTRHKNNLFKWRFKRKRSLGTLCRVSVILMESKKRAQNRGYFCKRFWINTLKLPMSPYSRTNSNSPQIIIIYLMVQKSFYYYSLLSSSSSSSSSSSLLLLLFHYSIMNGLLWQRILTMKATQCPQSIKSKKNVCYALARRLCQWSIKRQTMFKISGDRRCKYRNSIVVCVYVSV